MPPRKSNQKTSKAPARIWSYGCHPAILGADLVEEQLRLAHRYYNRLVELKRKYREVEKAILLEHPRVAERFSEVVRLGKILEEMEMAIRSERQAAQGNVPLSDTSREAIRKARDEFGEARRSFTDVWLKITGASGAMITLGKSEDAVSLGEDEEASEASESSEKKLKKAQATLVAAIIYFGKEWESVKAIAVRITEETLKSRAAAKKARGEESESGLYWGNSQLADMSFDSASKLKINKRTGWAKDVKWQKWTGEGRIGVQIQKGMPVSEAFANDRRFQITPVPELAYHHERKCERKRLARTRTRIRIGSDGRHPIWAEFPVAIHREMPDDGIIKRVWVLKERVGYDYRYTLQITIQIKGRTITKIGKSVGINIGWRKMGENDIRIAYLNDSDGKTREIRLPESVIYRLEKAEGIRSDRDTLFNKVRDQLVAWLKVADVPEGLAKALEFLPQWRSCERLAAVVCRWRELRFPGDEAIYDLLETWRKRNKHLYLYEANSRDCAIACRKDFYRKEALAIVREYATIKLGYFDLRDVTERADVDEEEAHQEARHQRFMACLSSFRLILKSTCAREGCAFNDKDSIANVTQKCHKCGEIRKFDAAATVMRTCPVCGEEWDQDQNAAFNIEGDTPPKKKIERS
jgi:hypothetical protein